MGNAMADGACRELCGPDDWEERCNAAKLKIRSELALEDWRKFGFAGPRAADFAALAAKGDEPPGAIQRPRVEELSLSDFWERFEQKAIPCVLGGVPQAMRWPAWGKWSWEHFTSHYPRAYFRVGKDDKGNPVQLRVDHFSRYLCSHQDDSPLYLFDSKFGREGELLQDYAVPPYFPDDYMALTGKKDRPPYRWIGIGPRRSGTVVHQDPLCTSAWNTLLLGRKRWMLLPPETPKKLAKGKDFMNKGDDDEAINYFLDLVPRLRRAGVEPVEFVQHPGETVFLPGGWWHCVVNLDDTIAVTQNYAGRHNFASVWRTARSERPCWSRRWLRAMDAEMPELAARARSLNREDGFDMEVLLQKNRDRLARRRARRERRELRSAKRKACGHLDEAAWRKQWREEQEASSGTESTMSTSSSSSSTSSAASAASGASSSSRDTARMSDAK